MKEKPFQLLHRLSQICGPLLPSTAAEYIHRFLCSIKTIQRHAMLMDTMCLLPRPDKRAFYLLEFRDGLVPTLEISESDTTPVMNLFSIPAPSRHGVQTPNCVIPSFLFNC